MAVKLIAPILFALTWLMVFPMITGSLPSSYKIPLKFWVPDDDNMVILLTLLFRMDIGKQGTVHIPINEFSLPCSSIPGPPAGPPIALPSIIAEL